MNALRVLELIDLFLSDRATFSHSCDGIVAPPMPSSLSLSDARQQPRWYPCRKTLWNMLQHIRNNARLSTQEAENTLAELKIRSGGLSSGQHRNAPLSSDSDVSILYYQRQVCRCPHESATKRKYKPICRNTKCEPFVAIYQARWMREFIESMPFRLRVLHMDATGQVCEFLL